MFGSPLKYRDPLGLAIWIEGPSFGEPSFHQSVNVGNPFGQYSSYSFGMNGNGIEGEVYRDLFKQGPIEQYKITTPAQDEEFKKWLESQIGKTGAYGFSDICRSWSQRQFNSAPGMLLIPAPQHIVIPQTNIGSGPSRFTTGGASSSGTGTSQ